MGTAERIDKLTVVWPNVEEQHFTNLELDRYYRLSEGNDEAELPFKKN